MLALTPAHAGRGHLAARTLTGVPVRKCGAIIVGGGVAGLTAARALAAVGVEDAVVVSRESYRPRTSTGRLRRDRGLGLWNAAQHCVGLLGETERLRAISRMAPPAGYRDQIGRWISQCDPSVTAHEAQVALLRESDLLELLGDGVEVLEGNVIGLDPGVAFDAEGEGAGLMPAAQVTVRLPAEEEGGEVWDGECLMLEAPLVVAADGDQSKMRDTMFEEEGKAVASPWTCVRGFAELAASDPQLPPFETLGIGPCGPSRFACNPLPGQHLYWFATMRRQPGSDDGGGWRCLEEQHHGWHFPIRQICAEAAEDPDSTIEYCPRVLRNPLYHWGVGRVVLIGDAAHPMDHNMAQGASLAIEDAIQLAVEIRAAAGDGQDIRDTVAQGLIAFEAARKARVEACRRVTLFTQYIANHPLACEFTIRNVPQPLNSWVFDAFLDHSLTGRVPLLAKGYTPPPALLTRTELKKPSVGGEEPKKELPPSAEAAAAAVSDSASEEKRAGAAAA